MSKGEFHHEIDAWCTTVQEYLPSLLDFKFSSVQWVGAEDSYGSAVNFQHAYFSSADHLQTKLN